MKNNNPLSDNGALILDLKESDFIFCVCQIDESRDSIQDLAYVAGVDKEVLLDDKYKKMMSKIWQAVDVSNSKKMNAFELCEELNKLNIHSGLPLGEERQWFAFEGHEKQLFECSQTFFEEMKKRSPQPSIV